MKICIASWAPFHAGAEVAAERLGVGLREAGHDVLMVIGTDGETIERMRDAGLECELAPMAMTDKWRFWRHASAQRALAGIFRRWQPDVVHANDLPTGQMVGKAAKEAGIPRVCHHRFPFGRDAIEWLNKFGAERHVFVSAALMDEMCADCRTLADSPRAVVYDGLPLPTMVTGDDRQAARNELGLPSDKTMVLFAGQIIERKGVADLLHAWSMLPSELLQRANLLIVGDDLQNDGAYRKEMEQLAAELKSPATFFGFQRNVPTWLTAADMAVVPSHVEPLGNATLEAMAHSLPVVGGNVGGIPEMIVSEETGLLVPPRSPKQLATAIGRLIASAEERENMGNAARARCEQLFSLDAHTNAMVDQYRQAMAMECVST